MNVQDFQNQFESLEIKIPGVRLPEFKITNEYKKQFNTDSSVSNFDFLRKLCLIGFDKLNLDKGSEKYKEYTTRAKYELDIINELGFTDYILLVWDIINFCNSKGIPTGLGRGSAAGSLVSYLVGITKIDPLKYGLYFERFISKTRSKKTIINGITYIDGSLAPDIDCDVDFYRRQEVLKYIEEKYSGKTCKILTFNTLSSKLAIKEVGKIFGNKPEEEMTKITSLIPKIHGQIQDLEITYNGEENELEEQEKKGKWKTKPIQEFKDWCDSNKEVYNITLKIKDLIKNRGLHSSGLLISYEKLEDCCPIEFSSDKDIVSSYDMNQVSQFSLKVDILGLRAVSVVDDVCKILQIKSENIDLNHPSIYEALQNLKSPHGLFQIEADLGFKTTQKVKPNNFEQLSAILALARPGAMQFIDMYAKFTNTNNFQSIHPFFDDILQETGGLCLFQEQTMKMANKIGFNLDESEQIRRCITGDTLFISNSRGFISINTLLSEGYVNDLFLVMDKLGNQSWQKISNIWSNGTKQTTYVESENGMEVRASTYHQFLTNHGWKSRIRLNKGDYLISPKIVNYEGCDYIPESLAIIIAGIVTEGYFSGYNSTTFTNYNKDLMQIFCLNFEKFFNIKPVYHPCGRVVFLKKVQTMELNKYLPYGLSASKCLPEKMLGMTKETTRRFLSFILACEGGISQSNIERQRWFEFSSKNKKLCSQVQLLLTRFGIYSKLRRKWNKEYQSYYYSVFIKEYSQLVKLNDELTVLWSSEKQFQLADLIKKERKINFSFDLIPQNIVKKVLNQYPFAGQDESGRIYKRPLNRNSFQRICERSGDKSWINFSLNKNLFYNKFNNQKRNTREVEVFDFTIENQNTPFIIANGLVIHNCIGKKKIEEVKSWQQKIKDKVSQNKLDPAISDVLWKILNDSASYSFNKCLGESTIVETQTQDKMLWEVQVGDKIRAYDKQMDKDHYVEVLDKIYGEKELFEVELEDGRKIECSMEHKFMCEDKIMRPLRDILAQNYQITSNN